jgi:predicted transcriptional regulator
MGRPKIYDEPRIATAIRLPTSLRDELLKVATARDVSVTFLVTRAVSDYLRRLPMPGEWLDEAAEGPSGSPRPAERTAS